MNRFFPVLFFTLVLTGPLAADDFELPSIPAERQGTWMPQVFLDRLASVHSYSEALAAASKAGAHHVLWVESKKIWSNAGFHDGYAVAAREFQGWSWDGSAAGPAWVDAQGNRYRKVSWSSVKDYPALAALIVGTALDPDFLRQRGSPVSVLGSTITWDKKNWNLLLDPFRYHQFGFIGDLGLVFHSDQSWRDLQVRVEGGNLVLSWIAVVQQTENGVIVDSRVESGELARF